MNFNQTAALVALLLTSACATTSRASNTMASDLQLPKIVQVDFKTLRTPAEPVPLDQIQTPEVQNFIKTMVQSMRTAPGVGLAAPQLGDPRQIIVLEDRQDYIHVRATHDEAERRGRYPFPLKIIINPKLTVIHPENRIQTAKFAEGCLSVEGYMGEVDRALEVKVEGWDENAKPFEWQVSGWPARILQHEVDHLNSTLYIEKMDRKTFAALPEELVPYADKNEDPQLPHILTIGNPILRAAATSVKQEEIKSPEIQKAISSLVKIMRKRPLVGMAASQIGILKRIIVLEDHREDAVKQRYPFPLKVIINPKLTFVGTSTATFPEASPCVLGYEGSVERHLEVKVEGWDENGAPLEWQVSGWPARILQHEVDHLDGILYTDRMETKTFKALPIP